MNEKKSHIQGSLFEEDFIIRTQGSITKLNHVALTELVANAWDAGAAEVNIEIPKEDNQFLLIEDDGIGMTSEEFKTRWMTMGYQRIRHQGHQVSFPLERSDLTRWAFGRNGVGRHGLLCFSNSYEVESWKDGQCGRYVISTTKGNDPFVLISEENFKKDGHGTKLKVKVERNLPGEDRIREILSARFLHDPKFKVIVNGIFVPLTEHPGLLKKDIIKISEKLELEILFIDSTERAMTKQRQGIAFWVGGRLVGEPSWILGNDLVIDGRTSFGKRYTFVVCSDDLFDELKPDWSGFKNSELIEEMYKKLFAYVRDAFSQISKEKIKETKEGIIRENKEDIRKLQPLARLEVNQFLDEIILSQPTIQSETLSHAVQAVINLEKSRYGKSLLEKLMKLSEDDIEGLDKLLGDWSVRDALTVLNEIDSRISVIEAIEKLSSDKKTDELHLLHPLITQARWIFGYEYESPEYSSNLTLTNAVNKVFNKKISKDSFINYKKRPDLLVLKDSTLSSVAIESVEEDSGLTIMKEVLLIELKKGASTIGRDEMSQAVDYIEDIQNCGLDGQPRIRAFVVGHTISPKVSGRRTLESVNSWAQPTTYSQLVRTANKRLFKLKEKLKERYEEVQGKDLIEDILKEPEQIALI